MGDYDENEYEEIFDDTFDKWRKEFKERHPIKHWVDELFCGSLLGYAPHYTLTHPHVIIADGLRHLKWAFQRMFRGWDDRVIWGIHYHISGMMPIWIEKLIETNSSTSWAFFDKDDLNCEDMAGATRRQTEVHQKIADGFRERNKIDSSEYNYGSEEYKNAEIKALEGMNLFVKYWHTLGD